MNALPEQSFANIKAAIASRLAAICWGALPRGLALFLGGFSLLNVLGNLRSTGFDANLWWIDLRFLPQTPAAALLLLSTLCLLAFAVKPACSTWRRWLTAGCTGWLGLVALHNTLQFYALLGRGALASRVPIPLSLLVLLMLAFITLAVLRSSQPGCRSVLPLAAVCLACMVGFPLAQMVCFGKTDYRRPGSVAVVLGARVYADGRLSTALADRVRTACQLYRDGWVSKLVFSGGPGDGAVHETEAMKRRAIQLGVAPEDIVLDPGGVNTQATVRNTGQIFSELRPARVLVVSHFYHLPRIKLAYQREGWEVYTVPARESYLLRQMPYNMAREVAALWVYYLRPLTRA